MNDKSPVITRFSRDEMRLIEPLPATMADALNSMKNLHLRYYSNSLLRWAIDRANWLLHRRRRLPTAHLTGYREEDAIGPVQREEALFLLGMIRVLRPRVLVELGFSRGRSAFNFLQAMGTDAESKLYSFDIADSCEEIATKYFSGRANFKFQKKSQEEITAADIEGKKAEFVFIDAAHEIDINQRTWAALLPLLAEDVTVAVHDTGLWHRDLLLPLHEKLAKESPERWLNETEYQHQPDERVFVNWIVQTHPEFQALHFHTNRTLRHGITILQRRKILPTN